MPSQRKKWSKHNMVEAIKACKEKRMGYKKSSRTFGVLQSTLERDRIPVRDPKRLTKNELEAMSHPSLDEECEEVGGKSDTSEDEAI
ncbi:hypothetical protein RN001_003565 [Aquatica leii]|uniref:HTH psq-type domain-containing protein n=1 Tax=Aquatica leii TaxID=1421715 RepID=A0AAN7SMD5_9COLE|nr:hypothetical protein RN001_003565 [Aquatica leii]